MIRVDASATEAALLEDPWIADAVFELHWPDEVTVAITERVPVAWTKTADGWVRRAVDGVALPSAAEPEPEMAQHRDARARRGGGCHHARHDRCPRVRRRAARIAATGTVVTLATTGGSCGPP